MANTIRIKRSAASAAPGSLANAELAYSEGYKANAGATTAGVLFIGVGTGGAGGSATTVLPISGPGAFLSITGTHNAYGTYTFSGGVTFSSTVVLGSSATSTTPTSSDNSTTVATTAFVKAQAYLTANQSIALSGDASGSGTTSITVTIASGAVTNAKLANVATSTIKGRVTAGTGVVEDLTATQVKTLLAIGAGDVSGFDTQVRTNRLNNLTSANADYSMGGNKLTNVATPIADTDAANKAYVDASRAGLDVKVSCRLATVANIVNFNAAPNTADGVNLVAGDRVLVRAQTAPSQNGIYTVTTLGTGSNGVWTRATDADAADEVHAGLFTFVAEGNTLADTGWVLTSNDPITLGTTALTFAQFSGGGVPGNYVGQTTITTLGTISQGTWNATTIGVAYGGTGAVSFTAGALLKGNGTGAIAVAVLDTDYIGPSSTIDGGTW